MTPAKQNSDNKQKLYLGVDGGATKTEAVLIDADGAEISRGLAAGSNVAVSSLEEALNRVYAAIDQALAGRGTKNIVFCLAISGVDTKRDKRIWKQAILHHPMLSQMIIKTPMIVNDSLAALRSGTIKKNAIVLISGTGSNCFGKNDNGEEAKSGGVNYILSDEGSAYEIGLKILKAVTKDLDGRGPKTLLTSLLFEKLNVKSLESLVSTVYEKPWNKADIGKIAPLVDEASSKNDKVAKAIVMEAATNLFIMAKAVISKLSLKNKVFEIVLSGSVFKTNEELRSIFQKETRKFSPSAKFVEPQIDSATAAAFLAKEKQ